MTEALKVCVKCGEEKPHSAFALAKGKPRSQCRKCRSAGNMAAQRKRPEAVLAAQRRYHAKPGVLEKRRAYDAEWRAKPSSRAAMSRRDDKHNALNAALYTATIGMLYYPQEFDYAGWHREPMHSEEISYDDSLWQ